MGGIFFSGASSADAGSRVREALLAGNRGRLTPWRRGRVVGVCLDQGLGPWGGQCASHSRCTGEEGDLWREWSHCPKVTGSLDPRITHPPGVLTTLPPNAAVSHLETLLHLRVKVLRGAEDEC